MLILITFVPYLDVELVCHKVWYEYTRQQPTACVSNAAQVRVREKEREREKFIDNQLVTEGR